MKAEFPGHFSSPQELEQLWAECLFVLDANVLLNLYRYSESTKAELLGVLEAFPDRLWIPHQVGSEYLSNRLTVIWEQAQMYESTLKSVATLRTALEHKNQHPFVSGEMLAKCGELFDKLSGELSEGRQYHENRIAEDDVKARLETLLSGRVGSGYSDEELENILIAGKARYDDKVPPGFEDAKKAGDSARLADRCRPYGDYIVWLQILDKAKAENKSIVFVTGDNKPDWWHKFKGRTIGPHPQLVEEFLSETGCLFHMYLPENFLERASAYLKGAATESSLNEIREVRKDEVEVSDSSIEAPVTEYSFDKDMAKLWAFYEPTLSAQELAKHTFSTTSTTAIDLRRSRLRHSRRATRSKLYELKEERGALQKNYNLMKDLAPEDDLRLVDMRDALYQNISQINECMKELDKIQEMLTELPD